jgi:quercetin dioxygenase-like cupin family protein
MNQYKIEFESMEWEVPAEGFRFKAFESGGRKLRLVEFSKEFVEADWCCNGHVGYILEGEIEIDFDGDLITFGAGDGVFIPAGEEHKHKGRTITDTVTAILVEDEIRV